LTPSTAWRRSHCWRTVARFMDRRFRSGTSASVMRQLDHAALSGDTAHRHERREPGRGEFRIANEAGTVSEAEKFGEVKRRACALLAPDHDKVVLVPVQPSKKGDTRLVE